MHHKDVSRAGALLAGMRGESPHAGAILIQRWALKVRRSMFDVRVQTNANAERPTLYIQRPKPARADAHWGRNVQRNWPFLTFPPVPLP